MHAASSTITSVVTTSQRHTICTDPDNTMAPRKLVLLLAGALLYWGVPASRRRCHAAGALALSPSITHARLHGRHADQYLCRRETAAAACRATPLEVTRTGRFSHVLAPTRTLPLPPQLSASSARPRPPARWRMARAACWATPSSASTACSRAPTWWRRPGAWCSPCSTTRRPWSPTSRAAWARPAPHACCRPISWRC